MVHIKKKKNLKKKKKEMEILVIILFLTQRNVVTVHEIKTSHEGRMLFEELGAFWRKTL